MFKLAKPFLFLLPPETAHNLAFAALRLPLFRAFPKPVHEPVELFGLTFRNKIGVAAGLDKNGTYLESLASMGFGHVEVGTVTPKPQSGNPRPRVFRLKEDKALINRMGFPSRGADAVAKQLTNRPADVVIGVNIGVNKDTRLERAQDDYVTCYEKLYNGADYFTVNVSSPNTPGLRELQQREHLGRVLGTIQEANQARSRAKPILLKVSPDLTSDAIEQVIEVAQSNQLAGFVATNTTIARKGLKTAGQMIERIGAGGLSGPPLRSTSLHVVRQLARSGLPVVACGGICSQNDAQEFYDAGARLVQLYTGLIYNGPEIVRDVASAGSTNRQ